MPTSPPPAASLTPEAPAPPDPHWGHYTISRSGHARRCPPALNQRLIAFLTGYAKHASELEGRRAASDPNNPKRKLTHEQLDFYLRHIPKFARDVANLKRDYNEGLELNLKQQAEAGDKIALRMCIRAALPDQFAPRRRTSAPSGSPLPQSLTSGRGARGEVFGPVPDFSRNKAPTDPRPAFDWSQHETSGAQFLTNPRR